MESARKTSSDKAARLEKMLATFNQSRPKWYAKTNHLTTNLNWAFAGSIAFFISFGIWLDSVGLDSLSGTVLVLGCVAAFCMWLYLKKQMRRPIDTFENTKLAALVPMVFDEFQESRFSAENNAVPKGIPRRIFLGYGDLKTGQRFLGRAERYDFDIVELKLRESNGEKAQIFKGIHMRLTLRNQLRHKLMISSNRKSIIGFFAGLTDAAQDLPQLETGDKNFDSVFRVFSDNEKYSKRVFDEKRRSDWLQMLQTLATRLSKFSGAAEQSRFSKTFLSVGQARMNVNIDGGTIDIMIENDAPLLSLASMPVLVSAEDIERKLRSQMGSILDAAETIAASLSLEHEEAASPTELAIPQPLAP